MLQSQLLANLIADGEERMPFRNIKRITNNEVGNAQRPVSLYDGAGLGLA